MNPPLRKLTTLGLWVGLVSLLVVILLGSMPLARAQAQPQSSGLSPELAYLKQVWGVGEKATVQAMIKDITVSR